MGIHYFKRFTVGKNSSVNISDNGPSFSIGPKHFKLTFSKHGIILNIYKDGFYYRKKIIKF